MLIILLKKLILKLHTDAGVRISLFAGSSCWENLESAINYGTFVHNLFVKSRKISKYYILWFFWIYVTTGNNPSISSYSFITYKSNKGRKFEEFDVRIVLISEKNFMIPLKFILGKRNTHCNKYILWIVIRKNKGKKEKKLNKRLTYWFLGFSYRRRRRWISARGSFHLRDRHPDLTSGETEYSFMENYYIF